ncbi:hypothetical protein EJ03DRAFT_327741 [Teratosphaeria nubilosa]|uniref:Extracellular membrane protein CFEM domain-containing protein n=1 Tax=Teratosphaeria nubilosa TaxID=161662 RepID=A0A6G1L7Q6_9PEZI|nr:hypothetical protein EJ03DRAFT_327741 [Teratosphaeria nubilosa]
MQLKSSYSLAALLAIAIQAQADNMHFCICHSWPADEPVYEATKRVCGNWTSGAQFEDYPPYAVCVPAIHVPADANH